MKIITKLSIVASLGLLLIIALSGCKSKGEAPVVVSSNEITIGVGVKAPDWTKVVIVEDDIDEEIIIDESMIDASNVNHDIIGVYEVVYTITDSDDNETIFKLTVNVVDKTNPIVDLRGESFVYLTVGEEYVEQGVIMYDSYDNNLTYDVEGTVDTNTIGDYFLNYTVTDSSGNTSIKITRLVVVENLKQMVSDKDEIYFSIGDFEITKEDLGLFKTNLHHELQHVADPNLKRNPEDINKIADDATLALIIDIQEVDEDTVFPTYEETVNKIFLKYMNRRPTEYDTPFLDKIKNKYPEEQFNDVINRIKSGDHPYYNSPIEKAANLKDFTRIFSVSNLLGIKDLISKKPSYTMEKHIKVISDILRSPTSDKFKAVLGLLEIKYPEAEQTMNPLFILNANTNPKYALQFKKQLGNIINELQELTRDN